MMTPGEESGPGCVCLCRSTPTGKANEVGCVATDSASRVVITSTERLVHVPPGVAVLEVAGPFPVVRTRCMRSG